MPGTWTRISCGLVTGGLLAITGCAEKRSPTPAVDVGPVSDGPSTDIVPAFDGRIFDSGPRDGALVDGGGPFPVTYDKSRIELVSQTTQKVGRATFTTRFYRNRAYRCGKSGYFTFLVLEQQQHAGVKRPLWVLMHGGGVGYFTKSKVYFGGEARLDEESAAELLGVIQNHTVSGGGTLKETIAGSRLQAGWRFMAPSMCDHDLYAGMGSPYPNNPYWGSSPDTVDGLLATMAAVDFAARGNAKLAGHPTSWIVLHGTSAGSVGAWAVSHAFSKNNVKLNGALLDAYLVSDRILDLFGTGCTPQEKSAKAAGITFDITQVQAKIGPFVTDKALLAERAVGVTHHVPLFDILAQGDPHCCGTAPLVPAAKAAGAKTNCQYVHGLLRDAMAKLPVSAHMRQLILATNKHVVTPEEGSHQITLQSWLTDILAGNPAPPWP